MAFFTKYYKYFIYLGFFIWYVALLMLPSINIGYSGGLIENVKLLTKTLIPLLGVISLPFTIKEKDYYNTFLAFLLIAAFILTKIIIPFVGLKF